MLRQSRKRSLSAGAVRTVECANSFAACRMLVATRLCFPDVHFMVVMMLVSMIILMIVFVMIIVVKGELRCEKMIVITMNYLEDSGDVNETNGRWWLQHLTITTES